MAARALFPKRNLSGMKIVTQIITGGSGNQYVIMLNTMISPVSTLPYKPYVPSFYIGVCGIYGAGPYLCDHYVSRGSKLLSRSMKVPKARKGNVEFTLTEKATGEVQSSTIP